MQSSFSQLVRQQLILKAMGFYKGPIDGQWGPNTISAKKRFESDMTYLPGLPSSGMPFAGQKPLPAGIGVDQKTGLLYHPAIDALLQQEKEAISRGPAGRPIPEIAVKPAKELPQEEKDDKK